MLIMMQIQDPVYWVHEKHLRFVWRLILYAMINLIIYLFIYLFILSLFKERYTD